MKSATEIQKHLDELKADKRIAYPSAQIQINAPLALIQVEVGAKINALEWVLGLPFSRFPLKKPSKE